MKLHLLLYISLLPFFFSSCGNRTEPFTFVQLCDPQLGFGGYEHDSLALVQAVKQINMLDPAFVVVCGDLVHNPGDKTYSDFKSIVSALEMPVYLAAGNHDMGSSAALPEPDSLEYYRSTIGNDYYSFTFNNYYFIVVNSTLWTAPIEGETEKHDQWLAQTLSDLDPKDSLIVIAHHQLFVDNPGERNDRAPIKPEKRDELLDLFSSANLVAYLYGHTHMSSQKEYGLVKFVSSETTSVNFDKRPFGFRLWEVTDTSVINEFVPLENNQPVQTGLPG